MPCLPFFLLSVFTYIPIYLEKILTRIILHELQQMWFDSRILFWLKASRHYICVLYLMTVKSNDSPGVSTYQSITCLLNNLFRLTTRKHQRSATPSLCVGIIRSPLNSKHKRTVTWKMFLFDDIIMFCCEILQALSQCALYRRINDSPKTNYMSNCWHYLRANDVKCRDVRSGS